MPGITHMYHLPGLTDLATQQAQAVKRQNNGGTSWVHEHDRSQSCNDKCALYEPQTEKEQKDDRS